MTREPPPTTIPTLYDYEAYSALPSDGKIYQIIDGELYVNPAPAPRHQVVSANLHLSLMLQLVQTGQGKVLAAPIDVVLDERTVVQPDLLFIRTERLGIVGEKCIEGPPDLVVEILSPSTRRTDVLIKGPAFARRGIPHYWIVDPAVDRIEFHVLEDGAYRLDHTARHPETHAPAGFPGLSLALAEIF